MSESSLSLSEMEMDAFNELMNISFGSAAADLAEVLDIFIHLNVPYIKILKRAELYGYIREEIPGFADCTMIEQKYRGNFEGSALLVFPYGMEKELLSYFEPGDRVGCSSDGAAELEKEVLMEIGNILIGACLGKIFELLDMQILYYPPIAVAGSDVNEILSVYDFPEDICITLKTRFSFEDRAAEGYMFLINNKDSVPQLRNALKSFIGTE